MPQNIKLKEIETKLNKKSFIFVNRFYKDFIKNYIFLNKKYKFNEQINKKYIFDQIKKIFFQKKKN